ncbi:MAG: dimethylargininase [Gemmatimonadetes bacterium]|nr:dimethylargininase [Gemmatimonadota bacterium]
MNTRFIALTRDVSPTIAECELTHIDRSPIRMDVARAQHRGYERLLVSLGCDLRRVAPAPEHPDAVFIEDTAVVLDDVAVIARPGAKSRRHEVTDVAAALAPLRQLVRLKAPATLDGGDVLVVGRNVYVGASRRTNADGIAALGAAVAPHGYAVHRVAVTGCLHLKSAVTAVDDETVLLNPDWVDRADFAAYRVLTVDDTEPMGANVLRLGSALVHGAAYARTRERLERAGAAVHPVDLSELAKAEGAVTCCSIVLAAER